MGLRSELSYGKATAASPDLLADALIRCLTRRGHYRLPVFYLIFTGAPPSEHPYRRSRSESPSCPDLRRALAVAADAEGFELAVQRRALHADEGGGARDV